MTDNVLEPKKWRFPSFKLLSDSFVVVYASGKNLIVGEEIHTNFKISAKGVRLYVFSKRGKVLDSLAVKRTVPNVSYGRIDDGVNCGHLENITFTKSNVGVSRVVVVSDVHLSKVGGFYKDSLSLNVNCDSDSVELSYTMDHSVPDGGNKVKDSVLLVLNDKSVDSNKYSNIATTDWQIPSPPSLLLPKCHVVRARCLKGDHVLGMAVSSFFIGDTFGDSLNYPLLSLVSDSVSLFSNTSGIYVPGDSAGVYGARNYEQRGREWERLAHVEFFTKERERVVDQYVGLRIHGGSSRLLPVKAMRVYARKRYGVSRIKYDFFNDSIVHSFKRLVIRASGQDGGQTYFRDVLSHRILSSTSLDVQSSLLMEMYINGEYWGLSYLRERQDKYYVASHYGLSSDSVTINKDEAYKEMVEFVAQNDLSDSLIYKKVSEQLDVLNFIDLCIADNYFYRWDYKNRTPWKVVNDGKWRWFLFDMDVSMGGYGAGDSAWSYNYFEFMADSIGRTGLMEGNYNHGGWDRLYKGLMKNNEFKRLFVARYEELLSTIFKPANLLSELNKCVMELEPGMENHLKRHGGRSIEDWRKEVGVVSDFLERRSESVRKQLAVWMKEGG